jgi:hypothetical protein
VIDKEGHKVNKPQSLINSIVDMLTINPVEFLMADKKSRTRILLETMPLHVDEDEVKSIIDATGIDNLKQTPLIQHALPLLDGIKEVVYNVRHDVNKSKKDKEGTVLNLEQTKVILDVKIDEVESKVRSLEEDIESLKNEKTNKVNLIHTETQNKNLILIDERNLKIKYKQKTIDEVEFQNKSKQVELKTKLDTKLSELDLEYSRKKAELENEFNTNISELGNELTTSLNEFKNVKAEILLEYLTKQNQAKTETQNQINTIITEIDDVLITLKQEYSIYKDVEKNIIAYQKHENLINEFKGEVEKLEKKSENLTYQLERIQKLKYELLNKLPINGIQVKDSEIYFNDVPFDRLNTATKVKIAVDIARLRAGTLKMICVDGIEVLDTDTFDEFRKQCLASELQLIVTKVADSEFKIIKEVA